MAPEFPVIDVTGDDGSVAEPAWLALAEPVHRQLRPGLPADYAGRLRCIFANGARMSVASEGAAVRGGWVATRWRSIPAPSAPTPIVFTFGKA